MFRETIYGNLVFEDVNHSEFHESWSQWRKQMDSSEQGEYSIEDMEVDIEADDEIAKISSQTYVSSFSKLASKTY